MKRIYIVPKTQCFEAKAYAMIAASLGIFDEATTEQGVSGENADWNIWEEE